MRSFTFRSAVDIRHICSSASENHLGLDVPLFQLLDNVITDSLYIFTL